MEYFPKGQPPSFQLGTLLLPAVAWANVGELAVDAFIHNLQLRLVGQLEDLNVLPAIGNDPYSPGPAGTLCTALELYHLPGTSTFVLQQRAPAALGRQEAAAQALSEWVANSGFRRVVMLAGLDAQQRCDAQLDVPPHQVWYLPGAQLDVAAAAPAALAPQSSTAPDVAASASAASASDGGTGSSTASHGAGGAASASVVTSGPTIGPASSLANGTASTADDLSAQCSQLPGFALLDEAILRDELQSHRLLPPWPALRALGTRGVPCLLLAMFAAEGDNAPDGFAMCQAALHLLACASSASGEVLLPQGTALDTPLQPPCSWALGLYGRASQLQYT